MGAPKVIPSITVTLTGGPAERLQKLVDSGKYDSAEAAVITALDDMPTLDDPELENWLRTEGVRRFDAAERNPSRLLTVDEVRRNLLGGD